MMEGIKLAVETNSDRDHNGEWLPTLAESLKIDEENRVRFYFEKAMSTNTTITVINDRKMQSLSQGTVRKRMNT